MSSKPSLEPLLQSLTTMENTVATINEKIETNRRQSNFVMRAIFILLSCFMLMNIHFMHVLTQEFRVVVNNMVEMYEHFGRVSSRMGDMTTYVSHMADDVKMMPVITLQMQAMNKNITSMSHNTQSMVSTMQGMDQQIDTLNHDVFSMANHFRSLKANVGSMGSDINGMSQIVP